MGNFSQASLARNPTPTLSLQGSARLATLASMMLTAKNFVEN